MRKAVIPAVLFAAGAAGVLALGPSADSPPGPSPSPASPAPPPPEPPRTAGAANLRTPARAEPPLAIEAPLPETSWREALHRLESATDPVVIPGGYSTILHTGAADWSEEDRARLLEIVRRDLRCPDEHVREMATWAFGLIGESALPLAREVLQRTPAEAGGVVDFLVEHGQLVELATGPDEVLLDWALRAFEGVTTDVAIEAARRLLVEHPEVVAGAELEAFSAFVGQAIGTGLAEEVLGFAVSEGLGDLRRLAVVEGFASREEMAQLLRHAPRILDLIRSPHARLIATERVLDAWSYAREKGYDSSEMLRQRLAVEPDATIRRRIEEALRER